jgi:aminoglycoside/choline kinase family phosphotransferase
MSAAGPRPANFRFLAGARSVVHVSSSSSVRNPPSDPRLEQLERWLSGLFGSRDFQLAPASADASFRRYFRVTRRDQTWIAMDAPPEKEDMEPYIRIASMLADVGVNAPRVLEKSIAEGFLLNSDLGSRTYLMDLDAGRDAAPLYEDAIKALVRIQARGGEHALSLPPYDEALLRREMGLFPDWFLGKHLGFTLEGDDAVTLSGIFDLLVTESLRQPQVFVHRDYHSRNLMVCDGRYGANPGILDFQDAVRGPVTYDLVSLLRDSYVEWPTERVDAWIASFREHARAGGVVVGRDEQEFRRWFDLMGAQRQLKVLGIFARLWHRDGKSGYLKDLPRTLRYVHGVSRKYRELQWLDRLIESRIAPVLDSANAAATA